MFHTSSQREHWLFPTTADIDAQRRATHAAAIEEVKQAYRADAAGSSRGSTESGAAAEDIDLLTYEETRQIIAHYLSTVSDFCQRFQPNLPPRVVATATEYLKRYYFYGTVLTHPPSLIFALAIFFACKSEDQIISLSEFCRIGRLPATAETFIRNNELHFMQTLKFHFTVHSPFRPLRGFFIDASSFVGPAGLPDSFHKAAATVLWRWVKTDVLFTHPPSQVALAALVHAAPEEHKADLDRYITDKLEATDPERAPQLRAALTAIPEQAEAARVSQSSPAEHARLKAKLQACRNPLFDPESDVFKRQKEDEDRQRAAKRKRRDEEWQRQQDSQLKSILGN